MSNSSKLVHLGGHDVPTQRGTDGGEGNKIETKQRNRHRRAPLVCSFKGSSAARSSLETRVPLIRKQQCLSGRGDRFHHHRSEFATELDL